MSKPQNYKHQNITIFISDVSHANYTKYLHQNSKVNIKLFSIQSQSDRGVKVYRLPIADPNTPIKTHIPEHNALPGTSSLFENQDAIIVFIEDLNTYEHCCQKFITQEAEKLQSNGVECNLQIIVKLHGSSLSTRAIVFKNAEQETFESSSILYNRLLDTAIRIPAKNTLIIPVCCKFGGERVYNTIQKCELDRRTSRECSIIMDTKPNKHAIYCSWLEESIREFAVNGASSKHTEWIMKNSGYEMAEYNLRKRQWRYSMLKSPTISFVSHILECLWPKKFWPKKFKHHKSLFTHPNLPLPPSATCYKTYPTKSTILATLEYACLNSHTQTSKNLLSIAKQCNWIDAIHNPKNRLFSHPLTSASSSGDLSIVQTLVQLGSNINSNFSQTTPLSEASARGHFRVVKYLVEQGADANLAYGDGTSPLWGAAAKGSLNIIKYLIKQGADVNLTCNEGTSPLWAASQYRSLRVVKYLIKQGADVNLTCNKGTSPLWVASQNGNFIVAQYLIKQGADVNLARYDNITPLWIASQYGHIKIVEILLNAGANANLPDSNGLTPLDISLFKNHQEVSGILQSSPRNHSLHHHPGTPSLPTRVYRSDQAQRNSSERHCVNTSHLRQNHNQETTPVTSSISHRLRRHTPQPQKSTNNKAQTR